VSATAPLSQASRSLSSAVCSPRVIVKSDTRVKFAITRDHANSSVLRRGAVNDRTS
jgi:hypothetical protein